MGVSQSITARSRQSLPTLPNRIWAHVPAGVSSRMVSNPASTTGIMIDRLLDTHTYVLRSAMKSRFFGEIIMGNENSLKDYSVTLIRLEAALSELFVKVSKLSVQMKNKGWEELDSSLVVIYDDIKVASKRAERWMKYRVGIAEIAASTIEVQRLSGKVEGLAKQEWERAAPTASSPTGSA